MGWFDEQIKQRKENDEYLFRSAQDELAEAVTGRKGLITGENDLSLAQDSISALLHYFHIPGRELPDDIESVDEILEYQLSPHGIMSREITLSRGWRNNVGSAMLGKLKDSGMVVALIPMKVKKGYRYFDPVRERYIKVTRANEKNIDPRATVFYKPFPQKSIGIVGLIRYIIENLKPRYLVLYAVFLYLANSMGLVLIEVVDAMVGYDSWLEDAILEFGDDRITRWQAFMVLMVGMIIVTAFAVLFKAIFTSITSRISGRIERELEFSVSSATMMRVLSLPPSFFGKYSSGELYERIQYVNELSSQLVEAFLTVGAGGLFSYMYIAQMFFNAPSLVLPAVVTTLLTIGISAFTIVFNMNRSREVMKVQAKESGMTFAMISGIRKIRLAGAEKRAFSRWAKLHRIEAKHLYRPPFFVRLNSTIVLSVSLIGSLVIYYFAALDQVSVADYYTFSAAYGVLNATITSLATVATMIATIKPTLEMAEPILSTVPEVTGSRKIVRSISGAIELNNVSFSYDKNGPDVISDLTLKIKPGQYVAIVGETGCGKSTLMRLMLGFEKPARGSVYFDGRDLQTLDVRSVRRRIGVVLQGGKLFSGSIRSNITITAADSSEEAAWEAAEMAGMADDIRRMPMGMETMISEGQGGISGGQKQRLLIARAIASKPRILMFDEATSALDNITQRIVSESLDSLSCTRIVIAHRLSTIKNCDRIVVLEKGRITEDGTFDELVEKDGFFAQLVKRQMAV